MSRLTALSACTIFACFPVFACGGNATAPDDGGLGDVSVKHFDAAAPDADAAVDDATSDASSDVTFSWVVLDFAGKPLAGVAVTAREIPLSTQTDVLGRYTLSVPPEQPITLVFTYPGYAKTIVHPFVFHASMKPTDAGYFYNMPTQEQFDALNTLAGSSPGSAIVAYDLPSLPSCSANGTALAGTTLGVDPPAGKTLYLRPGDGGAPFYLPDPSATGVASSTLQPAVAFGFDATGNVTFKAANLPQCTQAPAPILSPSGYVSLLDNMTLEAGALHWADVELQ